MARVVRWAAMSGCALLLTACDRSATEPPPITTASQPSYSSSPAPAATPTISSFSGPTVAWSNATDAPKYGLSWMVDLRTETQFTITGKNFGTPGTLLFGNSGYALRSIKSWSASTIVFTAVSTIDAVPNFVTGITVAPSNAPRSALYSVRLVPSIDYRPWGQCTWWTAYRSIKSGRQEPYPSAYTASGTTNADYVPQAFDVLWVNGRNAQGKQLMHQVFVENVSSRVVTANMDNTKGPVVREYSLTLSQYNARLDESMLTPAYVTRVQVQEQYSAQQKRIVKNFVSSLNSYTMTTSVSLPATNYWRSGR